MTQDTESKTSRLVDDLYAPEEDTPEARSRVYRWFSENLPSRVVVGIDAANGHDKSAEADPVARAQTAIESNRELAFARMGGLAGLLADQRAMLRAASATGQQEGLNPQHLLLNPGCIRPGRGEFVPVPPSDLERDRDYYKALHAMDQTTIAVLVAERDYLRGLVDDLTLNSTPVAGPGPEAPKTPHNPFREHADDRRRVGSLLGSIA